MQIQYKIQYKNTYNTKYWPPSGVLWFPESGRRSKTSPADLARRSAIPVGVFLCLKKCVRPAYRAPLIPMPRWQSSYQTRGRQGSVHGSQAIAALPTLEAAGAVLCGQSARSPAVSAPECAGTTHSLLILVIRAAPGTTCLGSSIRNTK
jgi:hypothetical protein